MEIIAAVQQIASPVLDVMMVAITELGATQAYIIMLAILYLAVDADLGRRAGFYLLASSFVNSYSKGVVDTPRPFELDPNLARGEAAIDTAPGAGFPSGHAQMAATFWGYLAFQVRRPWFWGVALLLVALISFTRIYLGVHMPEDLLGGWGIAAAIIALALLADRYVVPVLRTWPAWLLFVLGIGLPLLVHVLLTTPSSDLRLGAMAAVLTAPLIIRHHVPQGWLRRAAVAALGLGMVAGFMALTGLLPDDVADNDIVGFLLALAMGYVGLALAPHLARVVGLAPRDAEEAQAAPAPRGA